jgi:hypothetical protein
MINLSISYARLLRTLQRAAPGHSKRMVGTACRDIDEIKTAANQPKVTAKFMKCGHPRELTRVFDTIAQESMIQCFPEREVIE